MGSWQLARISNVDLIYPVFLPYNNQKVDWTSQSLSRLAGLILGLKTLPTCAESSYISKLLIEKSFYLFLRHPYSHFGRRPRDGPSFPRLVKTLVYHLRSSYFPPIAFDSSPISIRNSLNCVEFAQLFITRNV